MDVRSGRSGVGDLAFQVYGRTFHPEWFAVRAHRRYTQAGWEVDVRIIEGGHVVLWRCGRLRIAEVLSGPESPLPRDGLIFQAPVRIERSTALRPADHLEYQTCFSAERLDASLFAHLSDELLVDAKRNGLFHQFAPTNRLAPAPLSRVDVEPRPRGLSLQSFHTFPEDHAIVRTQSLFELRPPRP